MVAAAGFEAQLGIKDEVTYGTAVTVDRFYEFVEEGVKLDVQRIESKAIRKGRRILHRWAPGRKTVEGPITLEVGAPSFGLIFKHMFGTVNTTGAGPYVHTFTPGLLDGKSFTAQIGRPDEGGTVRPFTYPGGKVSEWELSAELEEYARLQVSCIFADEDTATALASASYPSTIAPFVYTHGSITIAGAAYDVASFTLSGDNQLKGQRHFIRATDPELTKEPKENGQREYSGSLDSDFLDLTAYNRFVNGTEAELELTFNAGASNQLVITCNVRFDGETPNVSGPEMLELSLPFKVVGTPTGTDGDAITAVLTNGDSAP